MASYAKCIPTDFIQTLSGDIDTMVNLEREARCSNHESGQFEKTWSDGWARTLAWEVESTLEQPERVCVQQVPWEYKEERATDAKLKKAAVQRLY